MGQQQSTLENSSLLGIGSSIERDENDHKRERGDKGKKKNSYNREIKKILDMGLEVWTTKTKIEKMGVLSEINFYDGYFCRSVVRN